MTEVLFEQMERLWSETAGHLPPLGSSAAEVALFHPQCMWASSRREALDDVASRTTAVTSLDWRHLSKGHDEA